MGVVFVDKKAGTMLEMNWYMTQMDLIGQGLMIEAVGLEREFAKTSENLTAFRNGKGSLKFNFQAAFVFIILRMIITEILIQGANHAPSTTTL